MGTDLGCPRAVPGTRRAHDFQPFAADMSGESRTLAVIFCRLCGVIRQVEVTPESAPVDMAPDWAKAVLVGLGDELR